MWNDPRDRFRAGTFSLLFVAAWHSLAIAVAQRRNGEGRELDEDTLVGEAFAGTERRGLRENVQFWADLSDCAAHRNVGALDLLVAPYAVAGLLNIEGVLVEEFGSEYALGESLTVPLPLSGFRDPLSFLYRKTMPEPIPLDVQAVLARAEIVAAELEGGDETFMMRMTFVPVAASDAVAYFVKPGAVPAELAEAVEKYVVLPARTMGSRPNFSAAYVIGEVERRTGHKLSPQLHADAARHLGARLSKGEDDRTVDLRYAEYITSFKRYLYSQSWIDHLVAALADADGFRLVTGKDPLVTQLPFDPDSPGVGADT